MTAARCDEHLDALPCRGCAADAKAADPAEQRQAATLTRQGVPPETVRQIIANARKASA